MGQTPLMHSGFPESVPAESACPSIPIPSNSDQGEAGVFNSQTQPPLLPGGDGGLAEKNFVERSLQVEKEMLVQKQFSACISSVSGKPAPRDESSAESRVVCSNAFCETFVGLQDIEEKDPRKEPVVGKKTLFP